MNSFLPWKNCGDTMTGIVSYHQIVRREDVDRARRIRRLCHTCYSDMRELEHRIEETLSFDERESLNNLRACNGY